MEEEKENQHVIKEKQKNEGTKTEETFEKTMTRNSKLSERMKIMLWNTLNKKKYQMSIGYIPSSKPANFRSHLLLIQTPTATFDQWSPSWNSTICTSDYNLLTP